MKFANLVLGSFLEMYIKVDIDNCQIVPVKDKDGKETGDNDLYFIDKTNGFGSIRMFKLDNRKYYKCEYEGENFITLTEKEFMLIKPFECKDFNGIIDRISFMEKFYNNYINDTSVKKEIKDFFHEILVFYHDIFYNGFMENINPDLISKSMLVRFKNINVYDKNEEILVCKDLKGEVMNFSYSMN